MRFSLFFLILIISGCAKNYNNEVATYKVVDNRYHITVSGKRGNMAHDPISLIFRGSSDVSEILNVPRITGVVKGSEITSREGYVPYLGEITFNENEMFIKLIYDYPQRENTSSWWDGKYKLIKE